MCVEPPAVTPSQQNVSDVVGREDPVAELQKRQGLFQTKGKNKRLLTVKKQSKAK